VSSLRLLVAFLLALCLQGSPSLGQASNPAAQPPTSGAESAPAKQDQDQPATKPPKDDQSSVTPEKKISPQEAQDLFKSADEILQFASKQSGLPIKHAVKHKLTSRDEVQKFIEKRMKDDPDRKRMEESEFVMKKFGLLPNDFNLSKFMVSMLREQVAGYYDTKTKTMNLLDWLPPEVQKPVMAHELTHALQDQYVNLDKWEDADKPEGKKLSLPEQLALDEERVARQSVTEGQAMLVLIDYSLVPMGSTAAESPDAVKMMEDQMMDGTGSPVFASAPLYIKRAMMFAYREGTEFERQVLVSNGKQGAFQGTLDRPPQDTREVMQPRTYLAGEHVPLLTVPNYDKVLGHGWEQIDFGALGQFDVNVLMELYADADTAKDLTPDWRGGYYYAAHKKGTPAQDVAFIYVSEWSDEAAASDFARLFADSWKQRYQTLRTDAAQGKQDPNSTRKQTEKGLVSVERTGTVVIAIESFPQEEAAHLRQAALEADASGSRTTAMIPLKSGPMFDPRKFAAMDGFVISRMGSQKP
jgi:hypothetical protein